MDFPVEIIIHIFELAAPGFDKGEPFLLPRDIPALLQLGGVCKLWRSCMLTPSFWTNISNCDSDSALTARVEKWILARSEDQPLRVRWKAYSLGCIGDYADRIVDLTIPRSGFIGWAARFSKGCHNLRFLTLEAFWAIDRIEADFPHLQVLELLDPDISEDPGDVSFYMNITCLKLHTLRLTAPLDWDLRISAPDLHTLEINRIYDRLIEPFERHLKAFPSLRTLKFGWAQGDGFSFTHPCSLPNLTRLDHLPVDFLWPGELDVLHALLQSAPNLKYLRTPAPLSPSSIRDLRIEHLVLDFKTPNRFFDEEENLTFIGECSNLKTLEMTSTTPICPTPRHQPSKKAGRDPTYPITEDVKTVITQLQSSRPLCPGLTLLRIETRLLNYLDADTLKLLGKMLGSRSQTHASLNTKSKNPSRTAQLALEFFGEGPCFMKKGRRLLWEEACHPLVQGASRRRLDGSVKPRQRSKSDRSWDFDN